MPDGTVVALKWLNNNPWIDAQRRSLSELTRHPRPHPAFAWPIDLVEAPETEGFGYVMPWISPSRFVTLTEMLESPPPLRVLAGIGRELADAFSKLHASGLCYRDINFGNLRVDPLSVQVAIVDNDNVGVVGGTSFVRGTLRFMAPEVVRGLGEPSTESDLHSLAVFLFYLLVHGHPLEGARVRTSYTWREHGHISETDLAVRHFGERPLFIFDPADRSNAPEPGDPTTRWWPIYPRFVQELFERAFGTGLRDSAVGSRVAESEWRRAMVRLGDSVTTCSCGASVFFDPEYPAKACWRCARTLQSPIVLDIRNRRLILSEGAELTRDHIYADRDYRTPMGVVEAHPREPGQMVLRNLSELVWRVTAAGEEPRDLEPGRRFAVRPAHLHIGGIEGLVRVVHTSARSGL
jgi:DNA-binding helix-hairpin-helix protein with protein kinase domain